MVTIKDVAQRAGVNPSTVSRVLKDNRSISQKTKEKVRKAMDELGYVPNVAAQMLANGLTQAIGVVLPPLVTPERLSEPFFMNIISAITYEAQQSDVTVSIATGMTMQELESQVRLMHKQKRVDGFIVLFSEKNDPIRQYLLENQLPFVVVGSSTGNENEITYIDNDNQLMGSQAVEYLLAQGHHNIVFVTDDKSSEISKERYFGYLRAMTQAALTPLDDLIFSTDFPKTLDNLLDVLWQYDVTGIVCVSDRLSVKLVQDLKQRGIQIPETHSLITFNNSIFSTIVHPYLTTFDVNVEQLGQSSLRRLLELIKSSKTFYSEKIIVPFRLIERESVVERKKD
ncbi:LacI family DNA-binding transcriptional regulator [Streptococcus sp. zg-JUN1979]|uniref:LacI family DNA-binding transcriptional regulator n=1 Tax=Streptococcus sp. zg-JUN1979 TaxID=3391450 RepID=UPI0039A4E92B